MEEQDSPHDLERILLASRIRRVTAEEILLIWWTQIALAQRR